MEEKKMTADDSRKSTQLFAQLIEILTQNAVMMLGGMPDRQGRTRPPDLNAAEMMIDMMGVLQKKTKGNLSAEEERMLSGTLYQLQTAFAEIASKSGEFEKARKATDALDETEEDLQEDPEPPSPTPQQPPSRQVSSPGSQEIHSSLHSHDERENKVKFTKKYG